MKFALTTLLFFIFSVASAQIVVDATDRKPIYGVIVQLLDADGSVVNYTITDHNGNYSIKSISSGVRVRFSSVGYATDTIEVLKLPKIVEMIPQPIMVEEVTVSAPKIRVLGDTLSYNVASFAESTDYSIGDVLRKMPGIEVASSGQINYNGTPINKFYIEGADMMENQYGVATNSISFNDVAAVEVMENHQPIRALEDVSFSNKAAINLRLKDGAKSRWVGSLKGGGGVPGLYLGEIAAMSFGAKVQTLNTVKGNNIGVDITTETNNLSISDMLNKQNNGGEVLDYITIAPSAVPYVNTRLGHNESVSSNILTKLSKQTELKASVLLTNSNYTSELERQTSYFLQDSTIQLIEYENSQSKNRKGSANLTLTTNSKDFYLRNILKGDLSWNDVSLLTTGTHPNKQIGTINYQTFNNSFEFIKRIGKQTINATSYNRWTAKPQSPKITQDSMEINENVPANAFMSNTKFAYSFAAGRWNLFAKAGVSFYSQNISESHFGYTKLYVAPYAEYKSKKGLMLSIDMPINYFVTKNRLITSINANVKYPMSARVSLTGSAGVGENQFTNSYYYSGLIMNDYRTISYGVENFLPTSNLYVSAGIAYKNPVSLFFANASVQYAISVSPYISDQYFSDRYLVNSFVEQNNKSSVVNFSTNISKGFRGGRAYLGVSYRVVEGSSIRNEQNIDYRLNAVNVDAKVNKKFTNWFSTEYQGQFSYTVMSISEKATWWLNQSARLIFSPVKQLSIIAQGSYLLNDNSQLFLLGVDARWSINKKWELSISLPLTF